MPQNTIRACSVALLASLSLMLGVASATPASAQDQPAPPPPETAPAPAQPAAPAAEQVGVVQRIIVQGNERIDQQTILSYLPIQVGDAVDSARIDLALKTLYRTDLFADIAIQLQGSDLVVQVSESPIINQVVFEGNDSLAEDKLRDEVTERPRGIFTRSRVQQDVQRLVELYRRSGRISATVTPQIVQLPQKRVDLIFVIDEGPKTGVARINFLGNRAVSDGDLRGVLVTEESHFWRFFSSNANYDPDRLEYDREQLRKYYTNRGFFDFRVVSAVAELAPDQRDFNITITVDEGPRFRFGDLRVETENQRLDPQFLKALLPIHKGDLYESDKIEDAVDALTYAAGAAGYAFVDIRPRYVPNRDKRRVDVVFQVREGPHVYVERIDVLGNTRTIDPVIRREMMLVEGDAYNKVLLERSRLNIRRLGFFKDVTIEEAPGSAPDRTVVSVTVEEQPTGELSFGAGFSSVDQFLVDFGVSEHNFRGRGQDLRARVSLGSLRQQVDFGFTEPHFLGRDLRAGVDLYSYRYDYGSAAAFTTSSTGGALRIGYPLNTNTYLSGRYNLRWDSIDVDSANCAQSSVLCDQIGSFLTSLVGYGLSTDRRNDPNRPTRGWRASFTQDIAGLGGDVNYVKTEVTGGWYYGIRPKWIVTVEGSAGYIDAWGGDAIRINDRFFKGGNTFRGFETAGMGPRDIVSKDALGGNLYAIGTFELSFPTYLPEEYGISGAIFADVGTVGLLDSRYTRYQGDPDGVGPIQAGDVNPAIADNLALRASVGVSVFWKSPMGPIRFDLSHVLASEDYDKTETFRFSTFRQF
jgi:outer membrane protein insertion porin family